MTEYGGEDENAFKAVSSPKLPEQRLNIEIQNPYVEYNEIRANSWDYEEIPKEFC